MDLREMNHLSKHFFLVEKCPIVLAVLEEWVHECDEEDHLSQTARNCHKKEKGPYGPFSLSRPAVFANQTLSTFSPREMPDTPVLATSRMVVPEMAARKPSSFSDVPTS